MASEGVLLVNAYGRLEELLVQPLSLKQLRAEAQEVFDLPKEASMSFKGPDGTLLEQDQGLDNLASATRSSNLVVF